MNNIPQKDSRAIERFNIYINLRVPTIVSYLLLMLILREAVGIPFAYITFFLVSFMLLSSLTLAFYIDIFRPRPKILTNTYFFYTMLDLFILTSVIYYIGGVAWLGFIFYSFYLVLNFMSFPRARAVFLTIWTLFLYLLLVSFQYLQILPFFSLFLPGNQTFFYFPYVFATVTALSATFILAAYYSYGFYQLYNNKILQLQRTKEILEKEKSSLETRVESRKKELKRQRKGLKERVEERKKELENEELVLKERAEELEKFQKIAFGRDKKLEELQRELKHLQGKA